MTNVNVDDFKRDELDAQALALNYPQTTIDACQNKGEVGALIDKGEFVAAEEGKPADAPEAGAEGEKGSELSEEDAAKVKADADKVSEDAKADDKLDAKAKAKAKADKEAKEKVEKDEAERKKREEKEAEALGDEKEEEKLPAGVSRMLCTVKHDNTRYEQGKKYKLGALAKEFKKKGFIK